MKRNIGNVWVSSPNYEAIYEIFYASKHKNISHTIDSIVSNYLAMSTAHEKTVQEISKLRQEIQELKNTAENYRQKVLQNE